MALHTQSIRSRDGRGRGAYTILVDATWPNGLARDTVRLDRWMPEIAPSDWLVDRFGRDPTRSGTFRSRYRRQLRAKKRRGLLDEIAGLAGQRDVVLLHGGARHDQNAAALILEMLIAEYRLDGSALPPSPRNLP